MIRKLEGLLTKRLYQTFGVYIRKPMEVFVSEELF